MKLVINTEFERKPLIVDIDYEFLEEVLFFWGNAPEVGKESWRFLFFLEGYLAHKSYLSEYSNTLEIHDIPKIINLFCKRFSFSFFWVNKHIFNFVKDLNDDGYHAPQVWAQLDSYNPVCSEIRDYVASLVKTYHLGFEAGTGRRLKRKKTKEQDDLHDLILEELKMGPQIILRTLSIPNKLVNILDARAQQLEYD